jgi:uncharacterized protein
LTPVGHTLHGTLDKQRFVYRITNVYCLCGHYRRGLGVGLQRFLLLALFGLAAQLIDGSLGMAYGLTSTTLLLAAGLAPAVASASVHLAEVGTTLASGAAHWKLGNTDWKAVRWLALPGGVGAFAGATVLSNLDGDAARPWISLFLVVLGGYVLVRFAFLGGHIQVREGSLRTPLLAPLGLIAGFLDAVGGGGWGPISTPTLLASGRMAPRKVIGTVDTSEFVVALCASAGFLVSLDSSVFAFPVVGALLLGGVVAAPMAAWLVRWLHPRILGAAVGGLIVLTNGRTLLNTLGVEGNPQIATYVGLVAIWAVAIALVVRGIRLERRLPSVAAA